MLTTALRSVRRFARQSIKDDEVGASRRDLYYLDTFKVTDDGVQWSYECQEPRTHSPATQAPFAKRSKSLNGGQEPQRNAKLVLPVLPPSLKSSMNRSDLLNLINKATVSQ